MLPKVLKLEYLSILAFGLLETPNSSGVDNNGVFIRPKGRNIPGSRQTPGSSVFSSSGSISSFNRGLHRGGASTSAGYASETRYVKYSMILKVLLGFFQSRELLFKPLLPRKD